LDIFDLIVIGSGFGGAMAALPAVQAGKRVLMIERGGWVKRSEANWGAEGFFSLTGAYSSETPYRVRSHDHEESLGAIACVGGSSVFYGGVALRLRERDFLPDPDLDGDSGAAWPYSYDDLEPYYSKAERLLNVAGCTGADPTEPRRSDAYPQQPPPLAPISRRIGEVAQTMGLHPFPLPLAINYGPLPGQSACVRCGTCDGFACAIGAKNDIATVLIPALENGGLTLVCDTVAVRLAVSGRRVAEVECVDRTTMAARRYGGRAVAVAAGALATPHLLLASGVERFNPASDAVGRFLMRHCNAVVMGVFAKKPAPSGEFHKQIGIQDYYYGHPSVNAPKGKLGCIQQFATPQTAYMVRHAEHWIDHRYAGIVRSVAHGVRSWFVPLGVPHISGLIVIAEDRPSRANRVSLTTEVNRFGVPGAVVAHEYGERDLAARDALMTAAETLLRRASAFYVFRDPINTFSHAVGTVRMGPDPRCSPLDEWSAFRGLDNLWVTDASVFPRSGGVNPSLTIAANALRAGDRITASL
jgi:choline dehydrogenase-like flavoprotein